METGKPATKMGAVTGIPKAKDQMFSRLMVLRKRLQRRKQHLRRSMQENG